MKRQRKLSILVFAALSVMLFFALKPDTVAASNPSTISFQGKVVNANGTNVSDGSYSFLFKLYTASSGGTALWTETDTLTVTSGVFQVNLGANCPFFTANSCNNNTPISFYANPNLYLGITFNSDPAGEMTPRVQLQSVPYAYNADNLGGVSSSGYAQLSGTQQSGSINISGALTVGGTTTISTGAGVIHSSSAGVLSSSAVVLGTDTSGNYVASLGSVTGLTVGGTSGVGSIPTLAVQYGSTSNTAVQGNTQITVTAGAGLSGGGTLTLGAGGSDTLSAVYGSAANTAVQGNVTLICPSGTGNLSGTGNTITLGSGGTCNSLNTVASPSFTGSVTAATGLTVTSGGATISGTVQGTTVAATGALQGDTLSVNSGAFAVNSSGAVTATTGITSSGVITIQTSSYTTDDLLVNDGQTTAPPTFPSSYLPALTVVTSETTYSRPLFFGYNAGTSYGGFLDSGACGSFTQMCLDLGSGTTSDTALENVGTTLDVGGGADGNFAATALLSTATTVSGTLGVSGALTASTGLTVSAGGATISGATTISGGAINLNVSSNFAINVGTGTSTGAIAIGSNLNTFSLASTGVDISTAGAISSVTTLTAATVDATSSYQANGTAGQTFSCGSGDYVNEAVVSEGIITNHSACSGVGLSDERLKTNINPIGGNDVLSELGQVQPVTFDYDCSNPWFEENDMYCDTESQAGVLAQQLMQVFPNLVNADQPDGYYSVNYQGLSIYTLEGVAQLAQFISSNGDANFASTTTNSLEVNGNASVAGALTIEGGADLEGNLQFNDISGGSANFNSGIISPSLVSAGALEINSGSDSNVTIDSNAASVNIGTATASAVNIGNSSATTTVNGPLVTNGSTNDFGGLNLHFNSSASSLNIDDAGVGSAISAAINVTDTSGNGYNNLISSTNFNVSGNGNIDTSGSIISKGGSFELYNPSGTQVVSFDSSGDATFNGALNMASASISGGLTVGGNVSIAGLSTFQQLATFLAKTVFRQDVEFDGHITVASDTAGYASLRTGESTVQVSFQTPYTSPPVVTATIVNGQFGLVSVSNVTDQGFTLNLSMPATAPTTLSWTALAVNNPLTATNPLPSQSTSSPGTEVSGSDTSSSP